MLAGIEQVRADPRYAARAAAFRAEAVGMDPDGTVADLVEQAAAGAEPNVVCRPLTSADRADGAHADTAHAEAQRAVSECADQLGPAQGSVLDLAAD